MASSTKDRTEVSGAQARRMLDIVKNPDANPAKIKTAFLAVMGEDIRGAGYTVEEIRDLLGSADGNDEEQDENEEQEEAPAPRNRRRPAAVEEEEGEDDEEEAAAPSKRSAGGKSAAKAQHTRTAAQIAATERMRAASAAKKNGKSASNGKTTAPTRVVEMDPKKILRALKAEDADRWDKVVEVTEVSEKGRPLRVKIRCKIPVTGDPERDEYGKETREIYVQDMFQVHYTTEGAKQARALKRTATREAAHPAPRSERKTGTGGKQRAAASTGTVKGNQRRPAR